MHCLSTLAFPSAPAQHVRHPTQGHTSERKPPPLSGPQDSTNRLSSTPPQILRAHFLCMTSFISLSHNFLSGIFILTSLNDTFSPRAYQHLCSSLHLTSPCTKPKGSMLTVPSAPKSRVTPADSPRRANESQPSSSEAKLNSLTFLKNLSPRFRCVTSLTSLVTYSIWDFYCDISEWHVRSARAWTPALMFAPN